jgi:hypothetical protein
MSGATILQALHGIKMYLFIALDLTGRFHSERPCCKNSSAEEYKVFREKASKEGT